MLFLAFTVEAQNAERTKRTKDRKSTHSSFRKSSGNSSRAQVAQVSPSNQNKHSRSSSVVLRSSSNRNTKYSSRSPVNARRETKISSSNSSARKVSSHNSRFAYSSKSSSNASVNSSRNSSLASRSNRAGEKQGNYRMTGRSSLKSPVSAVDNAFHRKAYTRNMGTKVHRQSAVASHYIPKSKAYKRIFYPFYKPRLADLFWTANMYRDYRHWYPDFKYWYYPFGYRIHTVSAYDAYKYIGEVARIYGVVNEVWYSRENRAYYLYIGAPYPYQDFTIILEAPTAKRYSWDPVRYFTHRQLAVSGLVSLNEQKPEMLIRKHSQINFY